MSETHPSAARKNFTTTSVKVVALILTLSTMMPAVSGPREQAKRMHDRIAGVPPSADTLAQMVDEIDNNNDPLAAAMLAIEHPGFYNVT
ncbi:MAG: hypothetical protein JAY64_01290, partial [Candidatus Thiodiazotropha weberae]|nr:hypothetical protein [Candidatus Thiodiazotropha lotti]MCW4209785.1 hypothetical protein [Candidatus Thiodiazotropha lotti]